MSADIETIQRAIRLLELAQIKHEARGRSDLVTNAINLLRPEENPLKTHSIKEVRMSGAAEFFLLALIAGAIFMCGYCTGVIR